MFTVCPKCSLKLVVTAADLRVAQGYVRCGRCSNIFNALVGLSDEQQAVLAREQQRDATSRAPQEPSPTPPSTASSTEPPAPQPPEPAPPQQTQPQAQTHTLTPTPTPMPAPAPTPEIARETPADELLSDAALEFDAGRTNVSEVFVDPTLDDTGATGQSETIILRTEDELPDELELDDEPEEEAEEQLESPADDASVSGTAQLAPAAKSLEETDEFEVADLEPLLKADPARRAAADRDAAADYDAAADGGAAVDHSLAHRAENRELASASSIADANADTNVSADANWNRHVGAARDASPAVMHDALEEIAPDSTPARRPRWLFVAGSAVLVLLLAAQIVHHYRARLAEVAWLRQPLTGIYAALGMPLMPEWNVRAYEVRQLGAVVDPGNPGTLTVRASIENTAPREQPLPLLRVTVQDRFGNRVAARDVPPTAYLPKASAGRTRTLYLGAGQRVDAEIALVDPGPRVVGFELDACLEDAAERVSCAHQPSSLR